MDHCGLDLDGLSPALIMHMFWWLHSPLRLGSETLGADAHGLHTLGSARSGLHTHMHPHIVDPTVAVRIV
eukprot:6673679-Pyramimonas_sp.AAC.1